MGKLRARFNPVELQFDLVPSSNCRDRRSIPPLSPDLLVVSLPLQMARFPVLLTARNEVPKIHLSAVLQIAQRLCNSHTPSNAVLMPSTDLSSTLAQRLNELANANAEGLLG